MVPIIIALSLVLAIIFIISSLKVRSIKSHNNKMEQILVDEDEMYKKLVDENHDLRKIRHDLKAQIRMANRMAAEDSLIDEKKLIMEYLLQDKKSLCVENNINYIEDIDGIDWMKIKMSENELLLLFTNLFNNAIESCMKVLDRETYVRLKVSAVNQDMLIVMTNSKLSEERPVAEKHRTTKKDVINHGFGVEIINDVIDNNNGELQVRDEGDSYCTQIVFKGILNNR